MGLKKIYLFLLPVLLGLTAMCCSAKEKTVLLGAERQELYSKLLEGKRVGLFTNQTGVNRKLERTAEILRKNFKMSAIFVPEHGLYGAVKAGEEFESSFYKEIPVFSLYGAARRPTGEMLEAVDIICVDIQDIGIRHYTYTSSLAYIMQEAAKADKEVLVFDRPNPLGGRMEGPILKKEWSSFIGLYQLPLRHGLTIGEFARYINDTENINCRLHVIPMDNWQRQMDWNATKLPWVMTSPLIPTAATGYMYGITGVTGDTNLSVGVGTSKPFYFVGAPFMNGDVFKEELEKLGLAGIIFRSAAFQPRYGNFAGETVYGVELYPENWDEVNLAELGYLLVHTAKKLYPDQVVFLRRGYGAKGYKVDAALGESSLSEGVPPEEVFPRWREETEAFASKVRPYLLYKYGKVKQTGAAGKKRSEKG